MQHSQSCSGTNTEVTQSVKCVINQWLKCLLNVHWLLPFILSEIVTSKWLWTPHACLSQWQWRLIGTSKQMQNHPDSTSKPQKGNQTVKYQVCTYMIYSYAPTIKHTGKKRKNVLLPVNFQHSVLTRREKSRDHQEWRCCKVKAALRSYAEINLKKVQDLTVFTPSLAQPLCLPLHDLPDSKSDCTKTRSPDMHIFKIWLNCNASVSLDCTFSVPVVCPQKN